MRRKFRTFGVRINNFHLRSNRRHIKGACIAGRAIICFITMRTIRLNNFVNYIIDRAKSCGLEVTIAAIVSAKITRIAGTNTMAFFSTNIVIGRA